ncbi:MAG TPA: PIN domain-containing protein [Micropepsaceae bacterium]|nr:PIN domain-containing protein [Micropepsaceae bacterium]
MRVFLDATVLYAAPVRDLALECASTDIFTVRWSAQVHREWMSALTRNRPDIPTERIERLRRLIDEAFPAATVSRYRHLESAFDLPDPDDHHVAAAAMKSGCAIIVTSNLRHFPSRALAHAGLVAAHPDNFFIQLAQRNAEALLKAAREVLRRLNRPPMTWDQYCAVLSRANLTRTAAWLARR